MLFHGTFLSGLVILAALTPTCRPSGAGTPLHPSPGRDEDPSIVRAADNTIYVAFYSNRDGQDRLYTTFTKDRKTFSAPLPITNGQTHDFYPSLLQSIDGSFHLVFWRGELSAAGQIVGSVLYMTSPDMISWSTPFALTDASALSWVPTLTERAPGELYVAFSSNAPGDKDIFVLSSQNGIWSTTPTQLVDPSVNDDLPSIVTRADGSLLMAWERYTTANTTFEAAFNEPSGELVYATSQDGLTWSAPILITNDPPGAPVLADLIPSLYPSDDPLGFSVAWTSARQNSPNGDVFTTPLTQIPINDSTLAALTDEPDSNYSAHLIPVDQSGLYFMVWVSTRNGATNPDLLFQFITL
jgi:hypothetical protein